MNWTEAVVNLLIALGVVGGVGGGGRLLWRRFRRGGDVQQEEAEISAAERLQRISLELVEPLRAELNGVRHQLAEALSESETLRRDLGITHQQLNHLRVQIGQERRDVLNWAERVNDLLAQHNLSIDPIPIRRIQ